MLDILLPITDATGKNTGQVKLRADTLALSAVNNNINLHDFTLTLNKFCSQAMALTKDIESIQKWREQAVDIYFAELERQGKLKFDPIDLAQFGDSEGDSDDDPSLSNKLS